MIKKIVIIFLWISLGIAILTLSALLAIYLSTPNRKKEFNEHLKDMEAVVEMIKKGELKVQSHSMVVLPEEYKSITVFGKIDVINNGNPLVLVFPLSKKKNDFDGFVFTSGNQYPIIKSSSGRTYIVHKLKNSWFYLDTLETHVQSN